jgi:sulfite exporter TauE/SafE
METGIFIAAFIMGALGSFHCIGMCGPLAIALPVHQPGLQGRFTATLLYNSGRVVTYSLFGLVAGAVGESFSFFGWQQWLSIVAGATIAAMIILPRLFPAQLGNISLPTRFFGKLRQAFGQLFFKKNQSALFAIGLLNGLLPCGLVYLALAGATATGNIPGAVIFMAAFGLGTLPVMWSIAFWGQVIGISLRRKIRKAYPYMMITMACLLMLRGMGLGIPYISPATERGKAAIHCLTQPQPWNK